MTKADECRAVSLEVRRRNDEAEARKREERWRPGRALWAGWPERCLAAAGHGQTHLFGKVDCGPPPIGRDKFDGFVAAALDDGFEVQVDHADRDGVVRLTVRWGSAKEGE